MAAFGLDIGSSSIKAVQLEKHGDKFSLLAAGIMSVPGKGMESEAESDLAQVAAAIKKLVTDTKITSKDVNLSLPESKVFTRIIKLPQLTDQEVSSAISWQAEQYIPIPIKEASVDYQIVGRREPQAGKPGAVEVLLIAAPKVLVEKYIKVITSAGLTAINVETELSSLARSLAPQNQTVLVVDLGATSSDLGLVENGQLVVGNSIATGGTALTRAVSTNFSINTSQAEEYKKSYGLRSDQLEGKVRGALEPAFRVVIDDIKKTIQYYKTELGRKEPVAIVILSGGVAGMPELASYLAEQLGIEVSIGDPFYKVEKDNRTNDFSSYAPLYGVAVGLAQNI